VRTHRPVYKEQILTVKSESKPRSAAVAEIPEGTTMPIRPGEDFTTLASEINGMTDSRELVNTKEDLVGVPMIMTSFHFRPGKGTKGMYADYVSVEATTYDNRRVVFNDSSTGIRRQIVNWLLAQESITLPPEDHKGYEGPDTAYQLWSEVKGGQWKRPDDPNSTLYISALPDGSPIRFLARYGLRASTYQTPGGAPGDLSTTFYLD
jgi:hypothetical protein